MKLFYSAIVNSLQCTRGLGFKSRLH